MIKIILIFDNTLILKDTRIQDKAYLDNLKFSHIPLAQFYPYL